MYRSTSIGTFNIFNKQPDNENNNNPIQTFIPHSGFLRFLLIKFFIIISSSMKIYKNSTEKSKTKSVYLESK